METVTRQELDEAGLGDWQLASDGLTANFDTKTFSRGLELINEIGEAAELANHHPDVTLTYPRVVVSLISHDVNAVTERDIALAQVISQIARSQDISLAPPG